MATEVGHSPEIPRAVGLLVDLEGDRAILSESLARAGYRVARCGTALEALRQVEQGEVRLMMAPLLLAHITGMELAGLARRLCPSLTIVLVPGDRHHPSVESALAAGANALLSRPLRMETVSSCLSPNAGS